MQQGPVLWHDLEQGGYRDDLECWRELADAAQFTLELGAGTGRVALEIAGLTELTVLDREARLVGECTRRAARRGLHVAPATQDALELDLGRRFDLIIAPAQFIQIIGDAAQRERLWERIAAHLTPGGLAAVAFADVALIRQDLGPMVARRAGASVYRCTELGACELDEEGVAVAWLRERARKRRHGRRLAPPARARHTYTVASTLFARVADYELRREAHLAGLRFADRRELPSATHLPAAVLAFWG